MQELHPHTLGRRVLSALCLLFHQWGINLEQAPRVELGSGVVGNDTSHHVHLHWYPAQELHLDPCGPRFERGASAVPPAGHQIGR